MPRPDEDPAARRPKERAPGTPLHSPLAPTREAFVAFAEQHWEHILRYARKKYAKRCSLDHALDAAHEAIVRAGEHWEEVVTYDYPLGKVLDFVDSADKKRHRQERREEILGSVDPPAVSSYVFWRDDDLAEGVTRWLMVVAAVRMLPKKQHAVIVSRYLLGMELQAIAHELKIEYGTACTHNKRGLEKLRQLLGAAEGAL